MFCPLYERTTERRSERSLHRDLDRALALIAVADVRLDLAFARAVYHPRFVLDAGRDHVDDPVELGIGLPGEARAGS